MILLTSRIKNDDSRSAVRFVITGTFGTGVQYALYYGLLALFGLFASGHSVVTVAFTIAYIIEVFINYLLTAYYTFSTRPSTKNLSGFVGGRVFNYFLQIAILHSVLILTHSEKLSGIIAILLAGIVNFFVMHFFFRK